VSLDKAQGDVEQFMQAMGQVRRDYPSIPTPQEIALRVALITEEFDETIAALLDTRRPDHQSITAIAEVMDGIADSIYVLLGTAAAFGVDMGPIWDEVHANNMTKTTGPVRQDGKRMKPPDYVGPDIIGTLRRQYANHQ
jgi:predicted HAD superfamily Cof-like phosphohydrolase